MKQQEKEKTYTEKGNMQTEEINKIYLELEKETDNNDNQKIVVNKIVMLRLKDVDREYNEENGLFKVTCTPSKYEDRKFYIHDSGFETTAKPEKYKLGIMDLPPIFAEIRKRIEDKGKAKVSFPVNYFVRVQKTELGQESIKYPYIIFSEVDKIKIL